MTKQNGFPTDITFIYPLHFSCTLCTYHRYIKNEKTSYLGGVCTITANWKSDSDAWLVMLYPHNDFLSMSGHSDVHTFQCYQYSIARYVFDSGACCMINAWWVNEIRTRNKVLPLLYIYRMCLLTGKPRVPTNTKQWVRLQEAQPLAQPLVIWARSASQLWSGNNSSKPSSLPWHFSVWLVTVYWLCSHQFTKPSQLLFNFPPLHVLLQPVQGT